MSLSKSGTFGVQTLVEVFRCFICLEKLRDARLCPHCSKLCCYPCIRRWLTDERHQCPHCQAPLQLHDFVNCRWAEEVTSQLDTLKQNELSQQTGEEKDKCELHKEKLTVYCSSCSKCICHQCALFNDSHTGHNFLPLDEIYQTNLSVVNEHLEKLKRRHVDLICLSQDIERNVENVKLAKDERLRELRNTMHAIQVKLDEQFENKMDILIVQRDQVSAETESLERTLHDIEHRILVNGKAEVISKQQDLLNSIQKISQKPVINLACSPVSSEFPSEIVPPYHSNTFVIPNFSLRRQNVDPIYSQPLHINGLTWRLKVYPDGNGTVRGTCLSVFLELTTGANEPSKYEYRIEMVHQLSKDPSRNIIREFASDFEVGECWGYNKFFSLDALRTDGFLDTNVDTLIIRFQVRPPTYQQKSRDEQWYIKQLENENQQLNNEIKNLNEKLRSFMTRKRISDEIISTAIDLDDDDEDGDLTETAIDVSQVDDDGFMLLKSNHLDSDDDDDDDDENPFAENDIENESISVGQSRLQHFFPQSTEIPIARSAIVVAPKPNSAQAPVLLNISSDENDNAVQSAFNASKYESTIFHDTLPFIIDENTTLANILERTTNANNNQSNHPSAFRPVTQNKTNVSKTGSDDTVSQSTLPNLIPLNNLVLLNSQSYDVQSSTDHDTQQRSHTRRQNRSQTTTNGQVKSERNKLQKK